MDEATQNLIDLAKEMAKEDPINFGELTINENEVYEMFATTIIEKIQESDNAAITLAVSVLHLTVENFVLNLKLNNGLDYRRI